MLRISIIDCKNVDYNLQLKSTTIHGKWKLQEVEIENDEFQKDDSAITDEASHHQYNSGTFIEISNTLNDEIRNAVKGCSAFARDVVVTVRGGGNWFFPDVG